MGLFRGTLLVLTILFIHEVSSQDAKTHCFKPTQTSAKLFVQCPAGHNVVIQGSLYGSNTYQDCSYTQDTCVDEAKDINVSECTGRQNCTLMARRMYSIDCGGYVNFFRVIYECFPDGVPVSNDSAMTTNILSADPGSTIPKGAKHDESNPIVWFGPAVPKGAKDANSESGSDTGIILAVVGCAIGTLYISIICIVLALLVRRNGLGPKKHLAVDEEQPIEVENTGYNSSPQIKERLPTSTAPEHTSADETGNSSTTRDPNGNFVQEGRPGPDGREAIAVFEEFNRPAESTMVNERPNTRVSFVHERDITNNSTAFQAQSLYPVEQLQQLPQHTSYYIPEDHRNTRNESRDYQESSRNVSNC